MNTDCAVSNLPFAHITGLNKKGETRRKNKYEGWRITMDLLRCHFRSTVELLDKRAKVGKYYFKGFGELQTGAEKEKTINEIYQPFFRAVRDCHFQNR